METYLIPCLLGLEKLVSDEVKRLFEALLRVKECPFPAVFSPFVSDGIFSQ